MTCHVSLSRCGSLMVVLVIVVVAALAIGMVVVMRGPAPMVDSSVAESDPHMGRRVYVNCQACHGIDGRGIAGYAPGLIAAPTLAGDSQAAILRILVGGNQVADFNAVMPSFSRLNDAEVAAVLTYVRSAWGNSAPPVEVDTVTAVRRTIADPRQRP